MHRMQKGVWRAVLFAMVLAMAGVWAGNWGMLQAQAPAPAAAAAPAPNPTARLELVDGCRVSYRVREQFVGINFPSDAVGESTSIVGTLVIKPDGSVDSTQSKLTIDLKSFLSDQDMRDNYIRVRTFEIDKFPEGVFIPRSVTGITGPLAAAGQTGFQLTGDMTIHGVTKPLTFSGVATLNPTAVNGRATTSFTFATFNMAKPMIGRLLSVDDNIQIEIVFRTKRS